MPLIIRLEGTNKKEAMSILQQSGLPIIFADNVQEAVGKLVAEMEEND